jgi:kynurenine formamidase
MADESIIDKITSGKVVELGHELSATIPVSPNHPGFKMALLRRHGDMVRADGQSASNEMILMGGHTGTHLDALSHVSFKGKLYGDVDAYEAQIGTRFNKLGLETVEPIVTRGVLLDVAGFKNVNTINPPEAITDKILDEVSAAQSVIIKPGDAVLIRSGWSAFWKDSPKYIGNNTGVPGPDESAARWISKQGVGFTGHDSMAYEYLAPGSGHALLPVHTHLLVESGIHIIENMNLDELAALQAYEFLFVCLPLKFVGGTGSPVRPIAIIT